MDIRKLQRAIVEGLEDVKGQHIVVFNTEALTPLFERVIIASGTSNRQTKALAASVRDAVKAIGEPVPRMEGEENGEWIIVDCGAAVAHVMQPSIREYYHLEEIWGIKPVQLKAAVAKAKAGLPKAEETGARASAKSAGRASTPASAKASSKAPTKPPAKAPARRRTDGPARAPVARKMAASEGVVQAVAAKTSAATKPASTRPAAKSAAAKSAPAKRPAAKSSAAKSSAAKNPAAKRPAVKRAAPSAPARTSAGSPRPATQKRSSSTTGAASKPAKPPKPPKPPARRTKSSA